MSDMAYAVHTGACTYLLDGEGVCRWVLSPAGSTPPGSERCVGAQFVACLDLRVAGGLVGELQIGAAALFARVERGRFVLLRTPPIEHVEFRDEAAEAPWPDEIARASDPALPSYESAPEVYPASIDEPAPGVPEQTQVLPEDQGYAPYPDLPPAAAPWRPEPAAIDPDDDPEAEYIDVEELVTYSEVTLTMPLYRPDTDLPPARPPLRPLPEALSPPPPRRPEGGKRGVVGPGRRLR